MSEIFMCVAEGGGRAKKVHATLELATEEAVRLSALPTAHGRVFVMADVLVIEKALPAAPVAPAAPVVSVKRKRIPVLPD